MDAFLKNTSEYYRLLFEENPTPMWIIDKETWRFILVNKSAINHYGYTCEEFYGMTIRDIRPKEDIERLNSVKKDGRQGEIWRHLKKDGSVIMVRITANPVTFEDRPALMVIAHDVTELIVAEQKIQNKVLELTEHKKFTESIVSTVNNIIFILDILSSELVYYNNAFTTILGYLPEEIETLGNKIIETLVHPDDIPALLNLIKLMEDKNDHETYSIEYRLRHKNGSWKWMLASGHAFTRDSSGKLTQIIGSITDISKQKEIEHELKKSETFLTRSQNVGHIGSWEVDLETGIITWTEELFKIHGENSPKKHISYEQAISYVHPEDIEKVRQTFTKSYKVKEPVSLNYRIIRADKAIRVVNSRVEVIRDSSGNYIKMIGITHDITEQISIEEVLRKSEVSTKAILNSIKANIAVIDRDGQIIAVNEPWNTFFADNNGNNYNTGIGVNYLDVCRKAIGPFAEDATRAKDGIQNVLNGYKKEFSMEYCCPYMMIEKWFQLTVVPLNSPDGGAVVSHFDITAMKKLEKERLQSQKLEAIGGLASGIAHDFNNLLTVILGSTNLAMIKQTAGKDISYELEQINGAAIRAANLTGQLLIFARKKAIKQKILDINPLISELSLLIKRIIGENIELDLSLHPDKCIIKADPGQIEQVIVNMCVNSRDAITENGKIIIKTSAISIIEDNMAGSKEQKEFILIKVSDTGSGIPDEIKDHIFEPFFTTKEVGRGTGLGLATSYGIISDLGGKIEFESEAGKGTTFSIYLPKAESSTFTEVSAIPDKPETKTAGKIFLIEDEPMVLEITSKILRNKGFEVLTAENPEVALKMAETVLDNTDLVITDIVMPFMNGKQLAAKLRAKKPDLKVLFMSGYAEDLEITAIPETDYEMVSKPFSNDTFLSKVSKLLKDRQ